MIAVVDYGLGNIHSVLNRLRTLGAACVLTADGAQLAAADGVILPGVGAFGAAAARLTDSGLRGVLQELAARGKPLLGICLGMQLLFERSEESPEAEGLGLIAGSVRRLQAPTLKIPHMGWTSCEEVRGRLLADTAAGTCFYFVHSYGCHATDRGDAAATATYGETFDAAVERGNLFGTQFHPEKSSAAGERVIRAFLRICGGAA